MQLSIDSLHIQEELEQKKAAIDAEEKAFTAVCRGSCRDDTALLNFPHKPT